MGANVFRMTCKHLAINHYRVFGKSDRPLIICLCFLTIIQGSSNLYNSIHPDAPRNENNNVRTVEALKG